jgi:hypothetical protein
MFVDWVDIKYYTPIDQVATPRINPMARDPHTLSSKGCGDNAPKFSIIENGGLHWGQFYGGGKNMYGGGRNLYGGGKKSESVESLRSRGTKVVTRIVACALAVFLV